MPNDPNRREITANSDGFTESSGSNAQNVNFTDLICEGPIRGLVGGSGGVFFDDVAVEEASLTEFSPPPTSTSDNGAAGEITFTGSGASSVGTVNDAVDLSELTLVSGSPRTIRLRYAKTTATLSGVGTLRDSEGTAISTKFTFEAESGTPFNSGWNTSAAPNQLSNKARAQVTFSHPDLDIALTGTFTITDGNTAVLDSQYWY